MSHFIDLIKELFARDISTTLATVFIIFMVWMYKELRTNYLENRKIDQQRFEKALEIYTEAEMEVYKYINNRSDFFLSVEKISKASVLFPPRLVENFNKMKEENNSFDQRAAMINFRKELHKEIALLKSEQINPIITSDSSGDLMVSIENFAKSKVAPFLTPVFHTYLIFILLFVVLFFISSLFTARSALEGIEIVLLFFDLTIYFILLCAIISEGFMKGRFNHKGYNWPLFIIFCITPVVFIFTTVWYVVSCIFLLFLFYMSYVRKKSFNRPQNSQS
ncbi:hypothetical protein [Paenibacillus sp. PAMC 26794]|uniref:hypothetical protein n=1 Tax=Paenibacillus sp. PAMC 26794 TaxID=1257080 RepID=UPI0002F186D1|nr:hypothetical protein [Paenibacillus sp. PAMC 26794]